MSGSGEKGGRVFKIDEEFTREATRRYHHHESEEGVNSFEYEYSTTEMVRNISDRPTRPASSTVPPVWAPDSEPVDYSNSNNDTVAPTMYNNRTPSVINTTVLFNTVHLPPPLVAVPDHPDLNNSLCTRFNETVAAVDWANNSGYDQSADRCEPELQDVVNNIPPGDVEAGIEYETVRHVFQFLTANAVGRFILAGASCFVSAATWRLLILVAAHLPIPPQHKASLLRALEWPKRFTASLMRSTAAVARGVMIGRRRAVSLEQVRPYLQADAGLIVRGREQQPQLARAPTVQPGGAATGDRGHEGASGVGQSYRVSQRQMPFPRRSLETVMEAGEEGGERNVAQSPPPAANVQMRRSGGGDCSVLRTEGNILTPPVRASPVDPGRYSPWLVRGVPRDHNTSTPTRYQAVIYDTGMAPSVYYAQGMLSPPDQDYPTYSQYPHYPASPMSPIMYREPTPPGTTGMYLPPGMESTPVSDKTQVAGQLKNPLLATPTGSQSSIASRASNDISLVMDGTVNMASPRWDLSPVVVEAVNSAGGVTNASVHAYMDRSLNNFQDLVRQDPEPAMLEDALAGASLELQSMRTAARILAVSNAGIPLPTDDGIAATTLDKLDEVLADGWHEDTPEVGVAIRQVMHVDSLLAFQEKELEMLVLRSRTLSRNKAPKKGLRK